MKCTVCGEQIGAAAYTVDLILGDDHCTLNLHQRCFRHIVGDKGVNALAVLALKAGWIQLALPLDAPRRA